MGCLYLLPRKLRLTYYLMINTMQQCSQRSNRLAYFKRLQNGMDKIIRKRAICFNENLISALPPQNAFRPNKICLTQANFEFPANRRLCWTELCLFDRAAIYVCTYIYVYRLIGYVCVCIAIVMVFTHYLNNSVIQWFYCYWTIDEIYEASFYLF